MQNLFHAGVADGIINRVNQLQPSSAALWGKMNVAQMLSHCQASLEIALGERKAKQRFIGILFGRIALKQFMKETAVRKNLPTDKSFVRKNEHDFFQEKEKLQILVQKFANSDAQIVSSKIHPFFGKMTGEEWGKLSWKHLDHHLQQFGA